MNRILLLAVAAFLVSGCMTAEQRAARNNLESSLSGQVYAAQKNAQFECRTKDACDKAFSRAKIFVHENADMRVQISDDTVISTYGPTNYRYCAMSVSRIPGDGGSATISPKVTCKHYDIEVRAPLEIDLYERFATTVKGK